ncbi:site-specific recombinase XerD [Actinoalloteichus sp. GBA129-24]|uniref:Site-specific recombinase XerD n=1 Tax=Actinoalloteichus fjordicus TaxID=1612552 RepID=A0AAC9PV07_9PSEU|nr:tyrosine-type recombinase/integrase [Actinoalloteichus fjordicus]APU17798.1 site-specific recombinase XerD [Actinoalloteichus fjordicus]APU23877.1 site-specific recombinase XerD [Actinoalloteichus sp. GBA129-24]
MSRTKKTKDLTGIRPRGTRYQVRVFTGYDQDTGNPVMVTRSAGTEDEAIEIRDRLRAEVRDHKTSKTNATLNQLLDEWLRSHEVAKTTASSYTLLARNFIRPVLGEKSLTRLMQLGPKIYEDLASELKRCRRRCRKTKTRVDHRVTKPHECDARCTPHVCKPLAVSSVRQVHAVLSGALNAAVRWGWISFNPVEAARKPRAPRPQPQPPTSDEAALIVNKAWEQGAGWGMLVWLVMVTGMRRGELVALRPSRVLFNHSEKGEHDCVEHRCRAVIEVRTNLVKADGVLAEKDTKSHQMRRISVDSTTTGLLADHIADIEQRRIELDSPVADDVFLFSYSSAHDRPCDADGITHRYSRMVADLGITTHLHALRHYSATELITAGVDLRTVAGRLGHGGGGTTTLRVYAAWVAGADAQAAELMASRMPSRPVADGE